MEQANFCSALSTMAESTSSGVKAEAAQTLTHSADQTDPSQESPTPQKSHNVAATTPQASTAEVASPESHDDNSASASGPARYSSRPQPKFSAVTEHHVREMMKKARKV